MPSLPRPLTAWERGMVEALLAVPRPPNGPDPEVLRETVPHLVVTGGCECGCPSLFLRDSRRLAEPREQGMFHYANGDAAPGGRVGASLYVRDGAPYSLDVMLPPDLAGDEPEARPDPASLVVRSPYPPR